MKVFFTKYWKWIVGAAIIIIGIIGVNNYNAAKQTASTITSAKVKRTDFIKSISSSGKTAADTSVDLKFQTSGKLAWVGVKEGDIVKPWQALASLDSREVRKNLEKSLRTYSSERNDFEQTWRVTYDGKTPNDAFNDTVKRILQKNQWDLDKAVLDVELQSLAVEFATLVTPIGGVVTHIDSPVAGVNITPATAVFSVADPTSLVFEANVDETEVGNLVLGQEARLTLDAFPDATFSGKVSYISYASETSSGGATVFPVKIAFNNPQNLRIGLNGDISIEVDRQHDVLVIPIAAVREETGGTYVYRKTGSGYAKTAITTGEKNDNDAIVTSGLSVGDSVVTKGFTNIPKK